ncbi:poly(3-hydroxyalkanoate) depolymerase [Monashia sp. NPDC004114]
MTDELSELRVLGQQVRVSVRPGNGSTRPLLLCNGIGASLELLQPFVDALDPAIEAVRFDVPGVGGSPMPPVPYTFGTLAYWLGKVVDRLGYRETDVLGISWGGGLAQQFAWQNPRRCRRLVLVSTATGLTMVPAPPRVLLKMMTPRRHLDPDYAASVAHEIYGGRLRNEPPLVKRLLFDGSPVGPGRGYLLQMLACLGWATLPLLPMIRQPTLLLAGEDDPLIPLQNAFIMRRLMPNATLHTYNDGHLGLVTEAEELAPVVAQFLQSGP